MSIRSHIVELVRSKRLFPYVPPSRHPAKRRLYLTEEAVKDLTSGIISLMGLRGLVEADLKRWVQNGRVYAGLDGRPRFLKPLCPPPPEIWEMRFTPPRVQARMFCRFAEPDTLIGTKFHTRQLLGDKGSRNWNDAMLACESRWNALFPEYPPFSAATIHEYVTENCDDFAIRC